MRSLKLFLTIILFMILGSYATFSAHVIKKEDAAQYSTKSKYSIVGVQEGITVKGVDSDGFSQNDDALNRFTAVTAKKNGRTYTNTWSDYTLTIDDEFANANDIYDFNGDGIKYDFGIYFQDYSRLAVYYTRLSSDLNLVASRFAEGGTVDDVDIGGHIYKHVVKDVPYPYGVETYNYYLREIDQKLMVIETFHEDKWDKCRKYIDEFEPAK